MKSDDRRLKILECVIDQFIRTGEPVSSNTVAAMLGYSVSSATIRNDMATLDRLGFLEQPHTSAGRMPTLIAYRTYISRLMKPNELTEIEKQRVDEMIAVDNSSISAVMDNALNALAEITGCAAVSASNLPKFSVITKVEVVPAGRRLYALLLITSTGDIKNKICRLEFDLDNRQLEFFENLVNKELTGVKVEELTPAMLQNLAVALGSYMLSLSPLLYTLYQISDELSKKDIEIKGEGNLLQCSDFDAQELVSFINTKNEISNILAGALDGIHVMFGSEVGTFAITNASLILSRRNSPNEIGPFGVIGPIRLDYSKIIPYVEYFSQSVGDLIQNMIEDKEKGEDEDGG